MKQNIIAELQKPREKDLEGFLDHLCQEYGVLLHGSISKIRGNKIISEKNKIFATNKAAIAIMRSLYSNEGVNLQYPYFIDENNPLKLEIHTKTGEYIKTNNGFVYILENDGFKNDPADSWQFVKEAGEDEFIAVVETEDKDFNYPVKIVNDLEDFYGFKSPEFSVVICESRKEFEEKTEKENTPNWLVGNTNENKIYIFSPEAIEKESNHKKEEFDQILTHEICHVYNREVNKNMIQWINEGICVFVAGQHKDYNFTKEDLENFFSEPFNPEKGYKISYWVAKTIFDLFGKEKLLELAKIDNDDAERGAKIEKLLGMSKEEFIEKIIDNKITKHKAIRLVEDFILEELSKEDWFSNIKPHIVSTILYGSVAKGVNRPDSDIDILMIVPLDIEKKYTKGEYFYDYKNQKINIVLRSIEKLRKIAEEKTDKFQKEIFRGAEVLEASDGEISELLKEIEKIK